MIFLLYLNNMFKSVNSCNNTEDFRRLAKQRLPSPIFHYIDGAADDEITLKEILRLMKDATWFRMF